MGFENKYEISNFGKVRSLDRRVWIQIPGKGGHYRNSKGKVLKPYISHKSLSNPVLCVSLIDESGIRIVKGVAHLVAQSFIDNPSNFTYVGHIDNDYTNNKVDNLRWVQYQRGLKSANIKRKKSIRCVETNKIYESVNDASRDTGLPTSSIAYNAKGESKYSIVKGYHFEYL